jgi:hypothetical protein
MSRVGLFFCAIYATAICICLALAFSAGGDLKGQFVFLQLPIALQGGALQFLGLGSLLANLSWVAAYAVIAIPTFGLLYFTGWFLQRLASDNANEPSSPSK